MTEEQAVDFIFRQAPGHPSKVQAANWVRTFVSLGMLKLDEPKSSKEQFIEAMERHGFYRSVAEQTLGVIASNGLKIVET